MRLNFQGFNKVWFREKKKDSIYQMSFTLNHGPQELTINRPELTQIYVHGLSDAIQPSHPVSSPSPPAFHLSQHQGLFQGVNSSNWPKY